VKYVAAEETMKSSFISKLFTLAGAITVKRTWRAEGTEVRRNLDPSDTRKIERALKKTGDYFSPGYYQTFCTRQKRNCFYHQTT
jgi:hypothetical protein